MPARHLYPMPRAAIFKALIALLLAAVSACGQKGALHLPERTPMVIGTDIDEPADPVHQPPAAEPEAVDASETDSAEDENDGEPRSTAPEPGP